MAMEEAFGTEERLDASIDLPELHVPLLKMMDNKRLQREFGKWLPKSAESIVQSSRTNPETGKPFTALDDQIASLCSAIQRIKDIEVWKEEQRKVRRAQGHFFKSHTQKVEIDGKKQWVDAQVYELPPLVKSEGTGVTHEPARYAIRLPDGRYVDLGLTQDGFKPVERTNPSAAMQSIAARLGIKMRGGDCEILRHLVGREDILPAYTTVWHRNTWLVIVGWQADPKTTLSSYWLDENGQLTRQPQSDPEDQLTLSELDYHLLCESSDLGIENEAGEIVDYMNEEEEFLSFMPQRENQDHSIDLSQFAEDDPEAELLFYLQGQLDRNETSITLGDVACADTDLLLEGELIPDGKGGTKWSGGLFGARHNLKVLSYIASQDPSEEIMKTVQFWEEQVARFERMNATREMLLENNSDSLVRYWIPNSTNRMLCMSKENSLKEQPKDIPGAALSPANTVEAPLAREVDAMPEHRTTTLQRVKRGTTALVATKDGFTQKFIPDAPKAKTQASNASPALKNRLRAMVRAELENGESRNDVAEAFHAALTSMLGPM